jgi:hypothetical protein
VAALLLVSAFSVALAAEELGSIRVTHESTKYYKRWDLTRIVYRVSAEFPFGYGYWVLEMGDCVSDEMVNEWASSSFDWVEEPFRGMQFAVTKRNEHFYVWLLGRWDVASTGVAFVFGGETYTGTIDGPACEGGSISIEIVNGSYVTFPSPSGDGTYPANDETTLRVTSTSNGWALSEGLDLAVPDGASIETVARIFQVGYGPFESAAGATEIDVSYALVIGEEDLSDLPEGVYTITVTFAVSTD